MKPQKHQVHTFPLAESVRRSFKEQINCQVALESQIAPEFNYEQQNSKSAAVLTSARIHFTNSPNRVGFFLPFGLGAKLCRNMFPPFFFFLCDLSKKFKRNQLNICRGNLSSFFPASAIICISEKMFESFHVLLALSQRNLTTRI